MKRWFLGVLFCLTVTGCKAEGDPRILWMSFSTYHSSPVVVTSFTLNGSEMIVLPDVVAGLADLPEPRSGNGGRLVDLPPDVGDGRMTFMAEWVELLTGRAWSAQVSADIGDLQDVSDGAVEAMAIFGPNGLFILASDPLPVSATDFELNDLSKQCATYRPENDRDLTSEAETLGLVEFLALDYPPVTNPECPDPEN